MAAHKHADLIKQWADGAVIQFYDAKTSEWRPCPAPSWYLNDEYRIKPAEPERVYPVTQMSDAELVDACDFRATAVASSRGLANAALRHAIDAGQVVTREDRYARDMAVAEAVVKRFVRHPVLWPELAVLVEGVKP